MRLAALDMGVIRGGLMGFMKHLFCWGVKRFGTRFASLALRDAWGQD